MKVYHTFTRKDLPRDKIQVAVDMSREKYCGVSANYKESMQIDHIINLIPA